MKKILVVEDDPVNQMILSDFLAANGYETVAASSGPEGIEKFETRGAGPRASSTCSYRARTASSWCAR